MIRDKIRSGLYCYKCGGNHMARDCARIKESINLPLETPSHNGAYQGTLPVRMIPPGQSGETDDKVMAEKRAIGFAKQAIKRINAGTPCRLCGKLLDLKNHVSSFCNYSHRDKYYDLLRKKNPKATVARRRTKWEKDSSWGDGAA